MPHLDRCPRFGLDKYQPVSNFPVLSRPRSIVDRGGRNSTESLSTVVVTRIVDVIALNFPLCPPCHQRVPPRWRYCYVPLARSQKRTAGSCFEHKVSRVRWNESPLMSEKRIQSTVTGLGQDEVKTSQRNKRVDVCLRALCFRLMLSNEKLWTSSPLFDPGGTG